MATLGKWSGTAESVFPTTSYAAPNALFPDEDRNDSSAYTFTSSTSTLTLPSSGLADGYLIVAAVENEITHNNRHTFNGKLVQTAGTGTFVSAVAGGYARDNSEDRAYLRTWAFIDNPSASATIQFQWKRDAGAGTPAGASPRAEFQVIPLYYADFGAYTSTSASMYGGNTPNLVTGFTGTDGTNITISSNAVSVTGDNKRYLILGGTYWEGRGGRTLRWSGLEIDGSYDLAAQGCTYYRDTSNDMSGHIFTRIIETETATRTIEVNAYIGIGNGLLEGGATGDGSTPSVGSHALVVIELNDSAEVIMSVDNVQSPLLATTGPVDLSPWPTAGIEIQDTASFVRVSDEAMNIESATDILAGANVSMASNDQSTSNRWTAYSEFTIDGTEDADSFDGDYQRNSQTFGCSANPLGFLAFAADEDLGVSVTELAGSEGGGAMVAPAGWLGMWAINLNTLEPAAGGRIMSSLVNHGGLAGGGGLAGEGGGLAGLTG